MAVAFEDKLDNGEGIDSADNDVIWLGEAVRPDDDNSFLLGHSTVLDVEDILDKDFKLACLPHVAVLAIFCFEDFL